ncbi:histidine kinase N-terminal 7TM domain-containing protein [Halostella litorea]|uniref:histidine kinase N-terminal 7TM domain-containing protein n=1 Tax=Halostella litorea TaxID=2528831 RepID=UPI001386ABF6|nr:histidine kinase N-terminal 7TM domain-containing protein [Halostella litorea]
MVTSVPWPAAGSFVAGAGTAALIAYIVRHRGKPGVSWFLAALCVQALWAFTHTVALLTFDPGVRLALETVIWGCVGWLGFLFFTFSLDYTGRGGIVRSRWFALLAAVPVASTALVATNGAHRLVWADFRVVPVLGVAAVDYSFGPAAYAIVVYGLAFAAVGVLLLVETVLSYGPLYRGEAVAVALSAVPIAAAVVAWTFDVGPWRPLNLTPFGFLPHLLLDAYAFVGTNMFETNPATRRAAAEDSMEGLGNPVVVLDPRDRVVDANGAARDLFDVGSRAYLEEPVSAVVGDGFDPATDDHVTAVDRGRRREFAVSASSLTDPTRTDVGRTLVFQDITDERRREQRLEVLNRVLRHNLRNEMTTIAGYASMIEAETDEERLGDGAEIIAERSDELVRIGERAREFEQAVEGEPADVRVEVDALLERVAGDLDDAFGVGRVTVAATEAELHTDPTLLELVVENLASELLERGDGTAVRIDAESTGDGVTLSVTADGGGLPAQEVATLRADGERPLQHGQGIGLWIARWSVDALGGDIAFDDGTDGEVRVRIPDAAAAAGGEAARNDAETENEE